MRIPVACLALSLAPLALVAAGCYDTDGIVNGGLACGANRSCPDGYGCRPSGFCWKDNTDGGAIAGGSDGPPPAGDGPTGKDGPTDVQASCPAPFGPFAGCAASVEPGSTCDPVCQAGCTCDQRCQLSATGFSCRKFPGSTYLADMETCDAANDLCRPGSGCMLEMQDSCGSHCYRYCRQNGDCPVNSRCRDRIMIADKPVSERILMCSPPIEACSPVSGSGAADRCSGGRRGFSCYVFGPSDPNDTTCECAGTLPAGAPCTDVHSCQPGYECAAGRCRRVCMLSLGTACGTAKCVPLFGSTKFGTCQ
jgi:hypothetical protein